VRIGRQWLAVGVIRIIDNNEQTEVAHWRVDSVATADHDDRLSREAPEKLGVSLRADLVAIPAHDVALGNELPQSLMVRLKIAPVRHDNHR
jgi:hypothetical protein